MPKRKIPAPPSVTLTALRNARGLTEQDLAERTGLSARMISLYERKQAPSLERLESLARAMGYGSDAVLSVWRSLENAVRGDEAPRSPVDPSPAEMALLRREASRIGRAAEDLAEAQLIELLRSRRTRRARRKAARLWARLRRCSPERQRLLVEKAREFQSWALAERLCEESEAAASDNAQRSLDLARLALRVAQLSPGGEAWRLRLEGYTLGFVANALRVYNRVRSAEETLARARELWAAGDGADAGLLPEWRLLDLEGSLRRDQRRFPEALERLDGALAVAPPEAVGRILLKRAFTLEQMGEAERAIETLRESARSMDGCDRRLLFALQFNLAVNLCHLDRFDEASELLPEVQRLAVGLRKELNLVRVTWLRAKIAAGFGREDEAEAAFEQARRELAVRELSYDYSLASLELAALWLGRGRTVEVRALAEGMMWAFPKGGFHRESIAALQLFCAAARQERATADWARHLVRYLRQARYNPDLRFER